MPRYRHIQNNFLAGELSPKSHARTDIREYKEGCEELENAVVLPQGGISRRAGTQFVASGLIAGSSGSVALAGKYRLIPLSISSSEKYMVVLGTKTDEEIRIIRTDNELQAEVTSETLADYKSFTVYESGQLDEVQYAQNGDFLFLTHPSHPPIYIRRAAENSFIYGELWAIPATTASGQIITSVEDWESWAYFGENTNTSHTLTSSATTGTVTVTSSINFWDDGHIGSPFKLTDAGVTGVFVITAVGSATSATAVVKSTLPGVGAYATWNESAWSDRRGWPRTVTFFEQRLYYGGASSSPDTIWASQIGDIFELMAVRFAQDPDFGTVTNDRPFSFSIASTEAAEIQWMVPGKTLFVGTGGREYIAEGDATQALGPLAVNFSPETSHGSGFVQAIRVSNTTIFVQASGQKMREIYFNRDENAFRAKDITLLGEHMVKKSLDNFEDTSSPRFVYIANQEADNGIIWCLDNNGGLYGCTRDREEDIIAWHSHIFGGSNGTDIPKVHSIAVVSSPDNDHDDLWMAVERIVNGSTVTYIEKMGKEFQFNTVLNDSNNISAKPIYCDSAIYIRSAPDTYAQSLFRTNVNMDFGGQTASITGTITSSADGLDMTSGLSSRAEYDISADSAQTGTVKIAFRPNVAPYTGFTPIASLRDNVSGNDHIALVLEDDGTGVFRQLNYTIRDDAAAIVSSGTLTSLELVKDVIYDLEINYDFGGDVRFFVNGKQAGNTIDVSGSTFNNPDEFWLGGVTGTTDYYIDEVVLTDTVTNTKDFTPTEWVRSSATITGNNFPIGHLEGETVQVVADGFFIGEYTVSSGEVDISADVDWASEVIIGLKYTSKVKTLPIEAGSAVGSSQGAISRIDKAVLRFYRTIGANFGSDENALDFINFRPADLVLSTPIPLFTGDMILFFPSDPDRKAFVIVNSSTPFPMFLSGINMRGITYD